VSLERWDNEDEAFTLGKMEPWTSCLVEEQGMLEPDVLLWDLLTILMEPADTEAAVACSLQDGGVLDRLRFLRHLVRRQVCAGEAFNLLLICPERFL
jgi:hypothetical protein